jgi:hypothetical protein
MAFGAISIPLLMNKGRLHLFDSDADSNPDTDFDPGGIPLSANVCSRGPAQSGSSKEIGS